jgi:hypothetical protein
VTGAQRETVLGESLRTCRRWLAEQDGGSAKIGVSMVAQEPGSPAYAWHPGRGVAVSPHRPPIANESAKIRVRDALIGFG